MKDDDAKEKYEREYYQKHGRPAPQEPVYRPSQQVGANIDYVQNTPKEVIAILCADIHLSLAPPPARAGEADWFAAMAKPLHEIRRLAVDCNCKVLCPGDVFDRWNAPPELINFALEFLPRILAVPGQHDLPFHNLAGVKRSAYGTLVISDVIGDLSKEPCHITSDVIVKGFPWGVPITPPPLLGEGEISIALVHAYTWIPGTGYANAPEEGQATTAKYKGWDVVVTGDNHIPFTCKLGDTLLWNCGSLMRRTADQADYRPRVGLLHPDKTITPYYLDISGEKFDPYWSGPETHAAHDRAFLSLMDHLKNLNETTLDFAAALRQAYNREEVSPAVRKLLVETIENAKKNI